MLLGLATLLLLFTAWRSHGVPGEGRYHSELAKGLFRGGSTTLPVLYSTFFATSGRCAGCHGSDSIGIASVDGMGRDVNVVSDWRSTLMANSARDPFFRAKMEHEVLVNPGHQGAIEGKCLSCHAPLGFHEQHMLGGTFTAAMLDTSIFGLDGVSCLACHQQAPSTAGNAFSGELGFTIDTIYGPYPDDEINGDIMEFFVGFRPTLGEHILDGRTCAGCHTLITETIDLQGVLTGDRFVEQATWHEWKNSVYDGSEQNCRGCHLPRINDGIILASEYIFLPSHSPFGLHHLVGGNDYMVRLLKDNAAALDVKAEPVHFDSTIARSLDILQHRTLELDLVLMDRTPDTAFYRVDLVNLAGHKFPSGFPSRRAIVEFALLNDDGDTLFVSGRVNAAQEVEGHDATYEPHHDVIRYPDQAQIYELVMGDVNGDVTTVLERALSALKDNRLVPQGFSTQHYAYDTTRIVGAAEIDPDFNHDALGLEGNGGDRVHYHVPMNGYGGGLHARARVLFQPVPPRWNQEMFSASGTHIDAFSDMVDQADGTPTVVVTDTLFNGPLGIDGPGLRGMRVFPNPASNGVVQVQLGHLGGSPSVAAYTLDGRRVNVQSMTNTQGLRVTLPRTSGTYLLVVEQDGLRKVERVVVP